MLTNTQSAQALLIFTHTRALLAYSIGLFVYKHEEFIYAIIEPDEISDNRILFHVTAIGPGSAATLPGYRCTYFLTVMSFTTPTRSTKEAIRDP